MATTRIFKKFSENPILTAEDYPGDAMYIFNPGAVKFKDEYLLMADIATLAQPLHIQIARSKDGKSFKFDDKPIQWPLSGDSFPEDCIYDPRITLIDDTYYIVYASNAAALRAVRIGIVKTKDFEKFERVAIASEKGNRNGVLFPEKINGLYCRMDRPFGDPRAAADIWLSYSPDLVFWGKSEYLMGPRRGLWDNGKIGAGAVPIKTDKGWLCIYHGTTMTGAGVIYRLGVVLLDLDNPAKIIARGEDAVLWPEYPFELNGRVGNVVFTCNAIVEPDGTVKIYYGAADTSIGLATAKLGDLIDACFKKNSFILRPEGSPYRT